MQREQHLLLRSMDECSVVAMECTPDAVTIILESREYPGISPAGLHATSSFTKAADTAHLKIVSV